MKENRREESGYITSFSEILLYKEAKCQQATVKTKGEVEDKDFH